MNEIIKNYEQSQIQQILKSSKVSDFAPGDTVKVNVKIKEGNKERVQAFQGVCIGKKNNGLNSSFTVRKFLVVKVLKGFFHYTVMLSTQSNV